MVNNPKQGLHRMRHCPKKQDPSCSHSEMRVQTKCDQHDPGRKEGYTPPTTKSPFQVLWTSQERKRSQNDL